VGYWFPVRFIQGRQTSRNYCEGSRAAFLILGKVMQSLTVPITKRVLLKSSLSLLSQVRCIARPAVNTSQLQKGRRTGALAMKVGMLSIFDKWGERHAVTALHLDNCQVVQVKKKDTEGYFALQLGIGEAKQGNVKVSLTGHYEKSGVEKPNRCLMEFRVTEDSLVPVGTKIRSMHFVPGQLVDVCGTSRGKGYAGPMKKWNFGGLRATHGVSISHRSHGATGGRQDPGRTWKGKKMAGRLGNESATVQNLVVIKIDPAKDVIYVKGAVPGANGRFVRIVDAVKGPFFPQEPPRPTFIGTVPLEPLFAPAGDKDVGDLPIPDDPY
jgi:large subunit ribosomal protein L3